MEARFSVTFLVLGLVSMQATAAILRPPVASLPSVLSLTAPVVDYQALTAITCGCGPSVCDCGTTVDCRIPTSLSPVLLPCGCGVPTCGCSVPSCGCGVPTCGCSVPSCGCGVPSCGCTVPSCGCGVPTALYSAPVVDVGCGCGALPTPLTPPFAPVVGCSKYLRQVCVQPPFL